ncbi:hypothetical protein B0I37DRAFT_429531, partial [Chaetomium sp. MPI-CAGE-AT-0009]
LPNELLLKVFEYLEHPRFDFSCRNWFSLRRDQESITDMKNARLVCHRFCDLASQQFIRTVRIGLADSSLAHLEEISHHPTLAKGVRVVRIAPLFYNHTFTDFDRFISHNATLLRSEIRRLESYNGTWKPRIPLSEMIANGNTLISILERLRSPDHNTSGRGETEEEVRVRLEDIHREYLKRLKNQELMVASGKYFRDVAAAMARMPGARNLQFKDTYYRDSPRDVLTVLSNPSLEVWNAFMDTMGEPGGLVLAPEIRTELSLSVQQLTYFDFTFRCQEGLDRPEACDFHEFLYTCLDTSSLQHVSLDIQVYWNRARTIDVDRVMESMARIQLFNVHLNSGTWKQALDELRKEKYRIKKRIVTDGVGAEADYMSWYKIWRIFGGEHRSDHELTDADRYILGQDPQQRNPIQALEDNTTS